LQRVDRSKCRLWALTNAYVHHARRVLRLLDVDDLFEAVISCDYAHPTFRCKPELEYYRECEVHTGIGSSDRFYLVDDSGLNVAGARQAGWNHAVLFDEDGTEAKKPVARGIPTEAVVSRLEGAPRFGIVPWRSLSSCAVELVDIWGDAVFLPAAAAKG
jgi:pyrimidine and pyridine-specific 5'-nucleotidase